jgi:hypothetical protein
MDWKFLLGVALLGIAASEGPSHCIPESAQLPGPGLPVRGTVARHQTGYSPPDSGSPDVARHRGQRAALPWGKRHGSPEVRYGGQGRSQTNDTRIFSTRERRRERQEAEDREGLLEGLTEPPCPTEPIPSHAGRASDRTGPEGHASQGVALTQTEPVPNLTGVVTLEPHPLVMSVSGQKRSSDRKADPPPVIPSRSRSRHRRESSLR